MVMVTQNAEKSGGGTFEQAPLQVTHQPQRLPNLSNMAELLSEIEKIAETTGEDRSGDWSGTQPGTAMAAAGTQTGTSPRDRAIAAIPETKVMLRQLEQHIVTEIKTLRRDIKRVTRVRSPGAAYRLNELYTRMRRLHALLHSLFETSVEAVRRLFIKVFIDKQPIL